MLVYYYLLSLSTLLSVAPFVVVILGLSLFDWVNAFSLILL
jgi:hypothetical protein